MNPILEKEPVKRAEKSIKEFDPSLKIVCLEQTARTAQDAATALGCKVGAIVKSLLFKAGDSYVLCLVSGDKRCSLNKLKKILDEKDVSMANPEDVKKITGYTIGGVSPTGHLKKIKIFIDETLNRFSSIFAAAGHPNAVFEINFENFYDDLEIKKEDLKFSDLELIFKDLKALFEKRGFIINWKALEKQSLDETINALAMASPFTNFEAPSIEP